MGRLSLRLPEELWNAIKTIAEKEQRSLKAQVLDILWQFVKEFNKNQG